MSPLSALLVKITEAFANKVSDDLETSQGNCLDTHGLQMGRKPSPLLSVQSWEDIETVSSESIIVDIVVSMADMRVHMRYQIPQI